MSRVKKMYYMILLSLWVSLFFFCSPIWSQVKIGDIEISEQLAEKYFINLYTNPDTVNVYIWIHEKDKSTLALRKRISEYGIKKLKKWGEFYETFEGSTHFIWRWEKWTVPRKPSASDFAQWMIKRKKPLGTIK